MFRRLLSVFFSPQVHRTPSWSGGTSETKDNCILHHYWRSTSSHLKADKDLEAFFVWPSLCEIAIMRALDWHETKTRKRFSRFSTVAGLSLHNILKIEPIKSIPVSKIHVWIWIWITRLRSVNKFLSIFWLLRMSFQRYGKGGRLKIRWKR